MGDAADPLPCVLERSVSLCALVVVSRQSEPKAEQDVGESKEERLDVGK
jgi:hypothetical protein